VPVMRRTVAASCQVATRAFTRSRSTVEPLSTTSDSAVKPTQLPEKRDSAQPYRPNSRYSATTAGASRARARNATPGPGEPHHPPAVQAELQVFRDAGGRHDRRVPRLEGLVALVRH